MKRAFASAVLAGLLVMAAVTGGCQYIRQFWGTDTDYLLNCRDVLTLPGREVELRATLTTSTLLREREDDTVRFRRNGKVVATAPTMDEGEARVRFTPPSPGDYLFRVDLAGGHEGKKLPETGELLVTCLPADAPIMIVDLDDTLIETDYKRLLTNHAEPLAGSGAVVERLAREYSIVYLTFRPWVFSHRTKAWLARHGYPRAPVLMSDKDDLKRGSLKYKTRRLDELTADFANIRIGVGDKISDIQAYDAAGMKSFFILHTEGFEKPKDYLKLVRELDALPEATQVVRNWREIEAALRDGKRFPRSAAQEALRKQAEVMGKRR